MPKRTDLHSILIIGAGPIVIGQACEFDYSGTQACKALRAEGYKIILVNSNPATIMTDPDIADVTYIEPITPEAVKAIIAKERPDALLPTLGGQTALNCALALDAAGVLKEFKVEMIGASVKAIQLAEDRALFQKVMTEIGLEVPKARRAHNLSEAVAVMKELGLPIVIRASFSLGGTGAGIAHTEAEFMAHCERVFSLAPNQELMLDEALIGWKEFELEVVRDHADNCIVVCGVENLDPLGVHTGDSITVAPIQTLTDKEYQAMRQASFSVLRAIGVDTGGSNVQFAIHPKTGRMVVIEMNPRVSRSSALVSKASGFPIAKIAAKLAVGYTLNECKNDITGDRLPASFEPSLDYVVVKIPRFNMEKFASGGQLRGPQMYSVGEVMAIGRTFPEALAKAANSLEAGTQGFNQFKALNDHALKVEVEQTGVWQLWAVIEALHRGWTIEHLHQLTHIDPWFLRGIAEMGPTPSQKMVYKRIDSCAGEFPTATAYLYGTHEQTCEANPTSKPKMLIIGSGPNRIGQGIEFDYCCVQAVNSLRKAGFETIMLNCNPETVSTDYDTVDRLYCTPLTLEAVLPIIELEKPQGVLLQYGGQTPLNLAEGLAKAGVPLLGLTVDMIHQTEDRKQFQQLLQSLHLQQPKNVAVKNKAEGLAAAKKLGFPLILRPSFVIGGTAMMVADSMESLEMRLDAVFAATQGHPVLVEQFLLEAHEVDVDALSDGQHTFIPGLLEHVEAAGIHSGDSACITPPTHLSPVIQQKLIEHTEKIAAKLAIKGVLNIQYAIKDSEIYVIEVNPRASRTLPFLCKATGLPLIDMATRCMLGHPLKMQGIPKLPYYCVKEAVIPFAKFPRAKVALGPEMKSTGEVMGIGASWFEAYAKAQIAAGNRLPQPGNAFLIADARFADAVPALAQSLEKLGFKVWQSGKVEEVPHCVLVIALSDLLETSPAVLATTRFAVNHGLCYTSTLQAAHALIPALQYYLTHPFEVHAMQTLHQQLPRPPKHLLTGEELSAPILSQLLDKAVQLKAERYTTSSKPLTGKHLALLFDKPSFRTRFSFTVAMRELGGDVIESLADTRKAEPPEDQIQVLAGYCHAVMVRTHKDSYVQRMAHLSKIPILNGLTDLHHPFQVLADLMTLQEVFGSLDKLTLAYVGDGNNILHSLLLLGPKMGVRIHYSCPETRGPNAEILAHAQRQYPGLIQGFTKPEQAVADVYAVYTDVWTSMGFENERAEHLFAGFQVNGALMAQARPDAIFMHCLPMERGKEVSETLPQAPCSVIYQQSENRLHIQKALLLYLLTGETS